MHTAGLIIFEGFFLLFTSFFLGYQIFEITDAMTTKTTVKTSSRNLSDNELMNNGKKVIKLYEQRFTECYDNKLLKIGHGFPKRMGSM